MKMKHRKEPIKSAEEAAEVLTYLAKTTAEVLGIDMDEALKRVQALRKSGLLEGGSAENPESQRLIDTFLQIPSSKYAHLL